MKPPLFLVQARLGSSRLPGKMLLELEDGLVLLDAVLQQLERAKCCSPDRIVVLTSQSPTDTPLAEHLEKRGTRCFRGDEQDVFLRFYSFLCSLENPPEMFFRVCADNPFLEPTFVDELFDCAQQNPDSIYFSHRDARGKPSMLTHYGFFVELVSTQAFFEADRETRNEASAMREHLTAVFYRNHLQCCSFVDMPPELDKLPLRLTVDTAHDLEVVRSLWSECKGRSDWKSLVALVKSRPGLLDAMREVIEKNSK